MVISLHTYIHTYIHTTSSKNLTTHPPKTRATVFIACARASLHLRPSTIMIWYPSLVLTSPHLGFAVVLGSSSYATFSNSGRSWPRGFHPRLPPKYTSSVAKCMVFRHKTYLGGLCPRSNPGRRRRTCAFRHGCVLVLALSCCAFRRVCGAR
jgi:hypothetical protein